MTTFPNFVTRDRETDLQDDLYNELMVYLGDWVSKAENEAGFKRRGLVVRRRCTSQPYAKNHDLLMSYAAERFASLQATDAGE